LPTKELIIKAIKTPSDKKTNN